MYKIIFQIFAGEICFNLPESTHYVSHIKTEFSSYVHSMYSMYMYMYTWIKDQISKLYMQVYNHHEDGQWQHHEAEELSIK